MLKSSDEFKEITDHPLKVRGSLILKQDLHAPSVDILGHLSTRWNVSTSKLSVFGECKIRGHCQANQVNNLGSLRLQNIRADHIQSSGYLSVAQDATARSLYAEGSVRINRLVTEESIELRLGNNCKVNEMKSGGTITISSSSMLLKILMRPFHKLICRTIEGTNITLYQTTADLVCGEDIVIGPGCTIREVHYSKSLTLESKSQIEKTVLIP